MEVQMAAQVAKSMGRTTPPHHHHHHGGGGAKAVPGYLRPAAGSCHHVCKYGGKHTFEEKERKKPHAKPRKQPPAAAPAPAPESQSSRVMVKVRSVFRRRVGDSSRADKAAAAAGKAKGSGEGVEWKDIVSYDTIPLPPPHGPSPQPRTTSGPVAGSGDAMAKKKDVMKGKKSHDKAAKITGEVSGGVESQQDGTPDKKANTDIKSVVKVKPPKAKKPMPLLVEDIAMDQELLHGYQTLSPSLIQSRASLLRDLEQEMVDHETTIKKDAKPTRSLNDDDDCAAAAEASRPIPAHRRVKSMSVSISSRSVRYPLPRQASKNSSGAAFKVRSRSTKAPPVLTPEEEERAARLRFRRGAEDLLPAGSTGRGIQLRIRSLRRRGVGGSGGAGAGFVVPAVALRHQKTLEKKKSQRLYNNMIEETASKLVKSRKSKVKALVGAFESVISKIAKK